MEGDQEPAQKTSPPTAWGPRLLWLAAVLVCVGLAAADYVVLQRGLAEALLLLLTGFIVLLAVRAVLLARENEQLLVDFAATDAFKTQLLRFISHEIANPLSPLKVQVVLLRDGNSQDPGRAWQAVDRSIGRLESLSRDVRLMALAETRRIVQSTTLADLVPRVSAAVQAHQDVARQRGVTLRADITVQSLEVPLDGERFDQVIDNLLSNAMKFTPTGGHIDVRLWRAPGGTAALEIKDSGAGMTPEQQGKLFTAFGRPKASTTPGLGLGLYLCKAIVDGHGGTISATSDGPGHGSKFRVELPVASAVMAAASATPAPPYKPAVHGEGEISAARPPDLPM